MELNLVISTNNEFDKQAAMTICKATAMSLNIATSDVIYIGTSFTSASSSASVRSQDLRGSMAKSLLTSYNGLIIVQIVAQTSNPASFYSQSVGLINSVVASGQFNLNLHAACLQNGVLSALSSATASTATAGQLTVIYPPTLSPTPVPGTAAGSGTAGGLPLGVIIGIAIAAGVVLCGCVFFLLKLNPGNGNNQNPVSAIASASIALVYAVLDSDVKDSGASDHPVANQVAI